MPPRSQPGRGRQDPGTEIKWPLAGRAIVTVAGSPEPIAPEGVTGWALIAALPTNTKPVYLGGPPNQYLPNRTERTNGPVATLLAQEGYPLNPSEGIRLVIKLDDLWLDAETSGQGVTYLALGPHASFVIGGTSLNAYA